jgi:hypothetical protein
MLDTNDKDKEQELLAIEDGSDVTVTPVPSDDSAFDEYSVYANPTAVRWLDENLPSFKKTGDVLNTVVDEAGKFQDKVDTLGETEGNFQALGKIAARTAFKASEGLVSLPSSIGSLGASLSLKIIENMDPIDQMRYQETADSLRSTRDQFELVSSTLQDSLENIYKGQDYLQASTKEGQETLDTLGDVGNIVGAASSGIKALGGIRENAPAITKLQQLGLDFTRGTEAVAKGAVGEFAFTPGNYSLDTLTDGTGDTASEKRLRITTENALGGELVVGATTLAKPALKGLEKATEATGKVVKDIIEDESGMLLPPFIRKGIDDGDIPDPERAIVKYNEYKSGKASAEDFEADVFEMQILDDQKIYNKGNIGLSPDIADKYAKGQTPVVDPNSLIGPSARSFDAEVQSRIASRREGLVTAPSGQTAQTARSAYINNLSFMENMYRDLSGSGSRLPFGEYSQLYLREHGGASAVSEGMLIGRPGSKNVWVQDDFGVMREVPDVPNYRSRMADGVEALMTNHADKYADKFEAMKQLKDTQSALDNYDNYLSINRFVKENINGMATKLGIDPEDLLNVNANVFNDPVKGPQATVLASMWNFGIPGMRSTLNLSDDKILNVVRKTLGSAVKDELDGVADWVKKTPGGQTRDQVMEVLSKHQGEPWFEKFVDDTSKWNQVQLEEMVRAGRISRDEAVQLAKEHPGYLPNMKQSEDFGRGTTKGKGKSGESVDPMQRRTISDLKNEDPVKATLNYSGSQALANNRSRANNATLKRIVSDLDDENFNGIFLQDRKKVMDAINESINKTGTSRKTYDAFSLLPEGKLKDRETLLQLGGTQTFYINGNRLELNVLDGDAWAFLNGMKYSRNDNVAFNAYRTLNRVLSNVIVKYDPFIAPLVAGKELMDTVYVSSLPLRQRLLLSKRAAQLGTEIGEAASRDRRSFKTSTDAYRRNAGMQGIASDVDWAANPYKRELTLESYILKQGSHGGSGGLKGVLSWSREAVGRYQEAWDTLIRSPEAQKLIENGLNENDAYMMASIGSTSFRASGSGVADGWLKAIKDSVRDSDTASKIYKTQQWLRITARAPIMNSVTNQLARETSLSKAILGYSDGLVKLTTKDTKKYTKAILLMSGASIGYELAVRGPAKTLDRANSQDYQSKTSLALNDDIMLHMGFHGQGMMAVRNGLVRSAGALSKATADELPKEFEKENPELYQAIMRSGGTRAVYGFLSDLSDVVGNMTSVGLGLPQAIATTVGASNKDSFGSDIIAPEFQDEPLASRQVGYSTSPSVQALTDKLSNMGVEVSPARLQFAVETFNGILGKATITAADKVLGMKGTIGEQPETPWTKVRPFKSFVNQNELRDSQIHNNKVFGSLSKMGNLATSVSKSDKDLLDVGKMDPSKYMDNQADLTLALGIDKYLAPYNRKIREIYKEIELVKSEQLPGTSRPLEERGYFGSPEKREKIDLLRGQMFDLKNQAIEGIYASFPEAANVIDEAVFETTHPLLKEATDLTKKTFDKFGSINSDNDIAFKGERQVLVIDEDEKTLVPTELRPEVPAITLDILEETSGLAKPEIVEAINNASLITGVSKDLLTTFVGIESTFGEGKNITRTDGPTGIFQFQPETWKGMVKLYGEDYGITMKDINDNESQAIFAAVLVKSYVTTHKNNFNGEHPSMNMFYAYHLLGEPQGVSFFKALKSSNPYVASSEILGENVTKSNPAYFGKKGEKSILEAYNAIKNKVATTTETIRKAKGTE